VKILLFYPFLHSFILFLFQCMSSLQASVLPEASEILQILQRIELEGLFFTHDKLAQRQVRERDRKRKRKRKRKRERERGRREREGERERERERERAR
jgi:hypothetical protein